MNVECCICLEECSVSTDRNILMPKCGHLFHDVCINSWIDINASCPQCRAAVTRNDLYEEKFRKLNEEVRKLKEENRWLKEENRRVKEENLRVKEEKDNLIRRLNEANANWKVLCERVNFA